MRRLRRATRFLTGWVALATGPQAVAASARFDWFSYEGTEAQAAPGTNDYHNPILQGFYPDPSLIRVGRDYYLANSTFAYFPGLPIFHSPDLVHWTQIANAVDRADQFHFNGLGVSEGLFAPSISEHDGTWYLVNICVNCGGNFLLTAKDPRGPWSKPIFIRGLDGAIDPSLFFDDDGSAWLVYNGLPPGQPLYDGHRAIWLQRFDTATGQTTSPRTLLVNGGIHPEAKPVWIEGPHIFKKDGFYYLIAAEGGTAENHSEVVLRSRSVSGPYIPGPINPILTQRDLPKDRPVPITSAGHASFVVTPKGEWWAAFLATRPYSDGFHNTGRETFLLPVTWHDGWPHILPRGSPIPVVLPRPDLPSRPHPPVPTSGSFRVVDDFTEKQLAPYWMMLRTPNERWYSLQGGSLVLQARPSGLGERGNPSFLARRQQHANATASTVVRFMPVKDGDRAGLAALQNDAFWYFIGVERRGGRAVITLERRAGSDDPVDGRTVSSVPLEGSAGAPLYLKIAAHGGSYDFYYSYRPNRWQPLKLGEDGTLLSTKRAGGFVGAMFGLYAYSADDHPKIAITFDDLPLHGPIPEGETPLSIARRTTAALKADGLTNVMGMVNGRWTTTQPDTIEALRAWRAAGLPLGNHTWSHSNLNQITTAQFEQEIAENEPLLQKLEPNGDWKWLRYPFLAEGDDPTKRAEIRKFLASRGYKIAAVTADFGDWQWTAPYARCVAAHDERGIAVLKRLYMQSARESVTYERALSKALYGRDIPYVLLMHIGALDSHMLPQLLDMYRKAGFRFVSLPEAERHPFYRSDVDPSLPAEPVNLEWTAIARGIKLPAHTDYAPLLDKICAAPSSP
jgi:xylan 1,4-beta-xylosidase